MKNPQNIKFKFLNKKDFNFIFNLCNSDCSKTALIDVNTKEYPFKKITIKEWINDISKNHIYIKKKDVNLINDVIIIIEKDNKKIGIINLIKINKIKRNIEIGIIIKKEYQNLGIGKYSLNRIINFIFNNLEIDAINAKIREDNISSKKLFKKCGFYFNNKKENYLVIKKEYIFENYTLKRS